MLRYGTPISRASITAVIATITAVYGTGTSRRTEEAIAPRSAPMLKTFAVATSATAPRRTRRE